MWSEFISSMLNHRGQILGMRIVYQPLERPPRRGLPASSARARAGSWGPSPTLLGIWKKKKSRLAISSWWIEFTKPIVYFLAGSLTVSHRYGPAGPASRSSANRLLRQRWSTRCQRRSGRRNPRCWQRDRLMMQADGGGKYQTTRFQQRPLQV